MWFKRNIFDVLQRGSSSAPTVKVLRGPRQVGKTSILDRLGGYSLILFDDYGVRTRALENPKLFLDQFQNKSLILDEATLVPDLFLEIKRRIDIQKREIRKGNKIIPLNYWITGSNQTLLRKNIQDSLAGRASYFYLNTLSVHEVGTFDLSHFIMKGGWPELHAEPTISVSQYLNDFISTFVERDIVNAAGIERQDSFVKLLRLLSGVVAQPLNLTELGAQVSAEASTIQSWVGLLENNGLVRRVNPFFSNLNKRLIKTPKIYFEDTGLATRLQGWTEFSPLYLSPYFGHLFENLVLGELVRVFVNLGLEPEINFIRSREKVEVDFIVSLPNKKFIVIEVKTTPVDFTKEQLKLVDSLNIDVIEKWVVNPSEIGSFGERKIVPIADIFSQLSKHFRI